MAWLFQKKKSPSSVTGPENNDSSRVEKKGAGHKCHSRDQNVVCGEGGGDERRKREEGHSLPVLGGELELQSIADLQLIVLSIYSLRGSSSALKPDEKLTCGKRTKESREAHVYQRKGTRRNTEKRRKKTASALNA